MKKIAVVADLHCGHAAGLLSPPYFWPADAPGRRGKIAKAQREAYERYCEIVEQIGPVDLVVVNGDAIEGMNRRQGGSELAIPDINEQIECAVELLSLWQARRFVVVAGTGYHVTLDGQDAEVAIAEQLGGEFHNWFTCAVNETVFDIRHWGGGASMPTTRPGSLMKEWLANLLYSKREERPEADVIVRSHIHSFLHVAISEPRFMAFFTPALCWPGSKYGARRCTWPTDWGLLEFSVGEGKGDVEWKLWTAKLKGAAKTLDLVI